MSRSTNESRLVVLFNPSSTVAEAYRTLRTNIQYSSVDNPIQMLMVASAQAGEGKSTVISNLAVAYAQEGKRVLLIDTDLRKPSLHRIFAHTNRQGLTNLLTGQSMLQEVLKDSGIENLSLITSGPTPPNPAELLGSARMKKLLEELKEQFDLILFDTPPVLAVTDSLIVSTYCDGVLLVIHAGKVKKTYVRKAKEKLDFVQSRIIGAVFNQLKRDDITFMKYYGSAK
ncbi:CpsD/CapB family tyrosine-protein kinase [Paenibacillus lupini]|uniref:CpsD/CapB family tyrosine-protein kinase n=1 Tax=Paenibacillus lupini TaxID=1450204 RepID=UPI00142227CD|nr:CpsD/CapB family tyrosine-protein kinase [Paenibacillus lupini]NIK26279.1 capsular exopolysaccharide synthesis family protein [Paenibacillus lupini]